ncbi:MAG: hypothetical protein AAGK21_02915 [Bacteroidota bacterium]
MSDQVPPTPPHDDLPEDASPTPAGAGEGATGSESTLSEKVPAVRPEQDEPNGPLAGLVATAAAEVREEAAKLQGSEDPEAEALLAQMGVEEEGIESGQLLGLVAATLVTVGALATTLILLFYIPYRTQVGDRADQSAQYIERQVLETEALGKLTQYTRADSVYGVPISQAMGLVVADYGTGDAEGLPTNRAEWNLLPVMLGPGRAVQSPEPRPDILPAVASELPAEAPASAPDLESGEATEASDVTESE